MRFPDVTHFEQYTFPSEYEEGVFKNVFDRQLPQTAWQQSQNLKNTCQRHNLYVVGLINIVKVLNDTMRT